MKKLFLIVPIISFFCLSGQETPSKINSNTILLLDGTAHIGNGEFIKRSAIAIKDGKITMVENSLVKTIDTSSYDQVIHIKGKHVYPGFIACNSTIGLMDIQAVRASRDFYEVGDFNPNIRSIIAYNTDSKITATVRTNGVLMGQICPNGGRISGSSSIVHFDAWNWEDAAIRIDEGIHLNWPKYKAGKKKTETPSNYLKEKTALNTFFSRALAYNNQLNNSSFNIKLNSMRGIFSGEQQLYIHADYVKELNDIIQFKKHFKIKRLCIVGGADSWMIAKRIKENNISIMIPRVHRLPQYSHEDIHLPYSLASILAQEGVLFCIQNAGDMQEMITRNLPFMVGTAIAYGLDYEKGVSSISLNAAKILGVDDILGSIEKGKDATLFISSGDAFDIKTNVVEYAFIQGKLISLENDQTRNYKKYKKKYGLE